MIIDTDEVFFKALIDYYAHRLQHLRIHLPSDAPPARAIGLRPGHRLPRGGCRVVHNMV